MTDTNKNEDEGDLFDSEDNSESKSKKDADSEKETEEDSSGKSETESETDSETGSDDSEDSKDEDSESDKEDRDETPSIEDWASKAKVDDDGNIKFAKGTPKEAEEAIRLYKKHEALQVEASESKTNLKATKAVNEKLVEIMEEHIHIFFTQAEKDELEELKDNDSDGYHKKMTELSKKHSAVFKELLKDANEDVKAETREEERKASLKEFKEQYPEVKLSMEDVPRALEDEYHSGKITFKQLLQRVLKLKNIPKKVDKGDTPPNNQHDLGKLGGNEQTPDHKPGSKDDGSKEWENSDV